MKVESVFGDGERVPVRFTADGDDVSPPLVVSNIPEGTKSLVLIVDDPDAPVGVWVHWVVFDIPVEGDKLKVEEGCVPLRGVLGRNDFGKLEYGGPAPPSGTHRYFFKVYALDCELGLKEGVGKDEVVGKMDEHILEKCELIGLFSRDLVAE